MCDFRSSSFSGSGLFSLAFISSSLRALSARPVSQSFQFCKETAASLNYGERCLPLQSFLHCEKQYQIIQLDRNFQAEYSLELYQQYVWHNVNYIILTLILEHSFNCTSSDYESHWCACILGAVTVLSQISEEGFPFHMGIHHPPPIVRKCTQNTLPTLSLSKPPSKQWCHHS